MPQLSTLVLKDSANADVTFTPNSIESGVAALVSSTGVPIGDKKVTVSSTRTPAGRRKMAIKVAIPVIQDAEVNGVTRPTVVRAAYVDMNFSFDGASTLTERKDILSFAKSLAGDAMIDDVVADLQGLY